jgi:cytochrome c biogenesis protein CcdA
VLFTKLVLLAGLGIIALFTLVFFPLNAVWWGITSTMYFNRKEMVQYTFIEPTNTEIVTQEKK